jgi:hypothetical protein
MKRFAILGRLKGEERLVELCRVGPGGSGTSDPLRVARFYRECRAEWPSTGAMYDCVVMRVLPEKLWPLPPRRLPTITR